ncbi:MAG: sigma-54-dependent Fis family transcriptional regulator [Fibrobacteres bacterium]|nr:sigma-54-dependent Fis family transcriptional regulator [Fibrobacterota bacterium]
MFDNLTTSIFCRTRYIAISYDAGGYVKNIINKDFHFYRSYCDLLSKYRAQDIFEMGEVQNLNVFFADDNNRDVIGGLDPKFYGLLLKELGTTFFRMFLSKNELEFKSDVGRFMCTYPLTSLMLFKISKDSFQGFISFNEIFYQMRSFSSMPAFVINDKNQIAGYTELLMNIMQIKNGSEVLLGKNAEILIKDGSFGAEESAGGSNADSDSWPLLLKWTPETKYTAVMTADREFEQMIHQNSKGLHLYNTSSSSSFCLKINTDLNLQKHKASIEIEYVSNNRGIPNLILNGDETHTNRAALSLPDMTGYNISYLEVQDRTFIQIKNRSAPIFTADIPRVESGVLKKFKTLKSGRKIILSDENGIAGVWISPDGFEESDDSAVYLFVRPGQNVTIKSICIRSVEEKVKEKTPQRDRVLALKYGETEKIFRSLEVNASWDGNNIRLFLLTDITDLHADLNALKNERKTLRMMLADKGTFIGNSSQVIRLRERALTAAGTDISVLIEGETGTGKEVLARFIHGESRRSKKPFIKLDCASIPASLMESELFGHEKGAFTGAVSSHAGRFEQAHGGTLFLDEVSNLPLDIQSKLLGILQDHEVFRLGGKQPLKLDFRILCASNEPLESLIKQGRFRADLYYRLNQYHIHIPPLRERKEDIPILAESFLNETNALYNRNVKEFTSESIIRALQYPWTGNVRELKSAVIRSVIDSINEIAELTFFAGKEIHDNCSEVAPKTRKKRTLLPNDREHFISELKFCNGNINLLMKRLSVSRPSVYKLLNKWALLVDDYRFSNPKT